MSVGTSCYPDLDRSGLFLFRGEGFTTLTHYFSPDTEGFISLTTGTDGIGPICLGVGYWPEHLECNDAVVTEVLCGTQIEVGDTFVQPGLLVHPGLER